MFARIYFKDFAETYGKSHNPVLYYPTIMRLKKKRVSLNSVEKIYNGIIPKSTLYFWYNKQRIPAQFNSFLNAKKSFSEKEIGRMGELMGSILGDGGIINKGHVHYCNTEQFLINRFKANMLELFPKEVPCETKDDNAMHLVYSPRIGRVLWCLFDKFSYGKDTKIITSELNSMPLNWKIQVVRALYDDEGSAVRLKKGGYISFKQKSDSITKFVQDVLIECGIKSIITDYNRIHMIRICSYADMKRFSESINFSEGYRKRIKLSTILESYKYPQGDTKNRIMDILKCGPKTYHEIAKHFELNPKTIRGHIHGWNGGSQKESLIKQGLVKVLKQGRKAIYSVA